MLNLRFVIRMFLAGVMVVSADVVSGQATSSGSGQDYPNRPIRIVTAPAGGGSDFTARLIAEGISGPLGQPVIVDNRVAVLADEMGAKAPPDGYTLLVSAAATWIRSLLQKVPFDVMTDFSPISLIVREVNVIAVHPSVPANSVKELIALAKAKPGALNYSSPGSGTTHHLGGELFKSMAGVDIVHIPSKGGAPAITALLGGEVQLTLADVRAVAPHAKSGKLRALAVTTAEPSALAPGLPTVAASGLPGYEMLTMTNIYAPGKTPGAIIIRLNQEIVRALNRADVKEKLLTSGVEMVGSSPETLVATRQSEITKWAKVIKDAGIKAD